MQPPEVKQEVHLVQCDRHVKVRISDHFFGFARAILRVRLRHASPAKPFSLRLLFSRAPEFDPDPLRSQRRNVEIRERELAGS
jgi:hypothetical protein